MFVIHETVAVVSVTVERDTLVMTGAVEVEALLVMRAEASAGAKNSKRVSMRSPDDEA